MEQYLQDAIIKLRKIKQDMLSNGRTGMDTPFASIYGLSNNLKDYQREMETADPDRIIPCFRHLQKAISNLKSKSMNAGDLGGNYVAELNNNLNNTSDNLVHLDYFYHKHSSRITYDEGTKASGFNKVSIYPLYKGVQPGRTLFERHNARVEEAKGDWAGTFNRWEHGENIQGIPSRGSIYRNNQN